MAAVANDSDEGAGLGTDAPNGSVATEKPWRRPERRELVGSAASHVAPVSLLMKSAADCFLYVKKPLSLNLLYFHFKCSAFVTRHSVEILTYLFQARNASMFNETGEYVGDEKSAMQAGTPSENCNENQYLLLLQSIKIGFFQTKHDVKITLL